MKILLLCFFLSLSVSTPYAQDSLVLVSGEWPPFSSGDLEMGGIVGEWVLMVMAEMGLNPDIQWLPWPRCYDNVKSGEVWASFPWYYTDERAGEVDFSEIIFPESRTTLFFYGSPPDASVLSPEDLKAYKLGAVNGYYYVPILEEAGLNYDLVSRDEQNFHKLRAGRVDFLIINELVGRYYVKKLFPGETDLFGTVNLDWPRVTSGIDGMRLLVSRTYPESQHLLDEFNGALQRLKANGTWDKYLGSHGITR